MHGNLSIKLVLALANKSTVDRSRNVFCSHLEYNRPITPPQISVLVSYHESDNGYNHARIAYVIYQRQMMIT